ncbi:ATP-binding region [Symmachiella dynata]|uniref:ATP-binding region n=1 Tax=Symmachiella dynata TaxID=2527995 RepID=A0A517ZLF5_9PLAN|nr:adenine nucleotide alpha hydrolase [Symmachiella dynata]QDU43263.1 ATP-binding region [Symmachiella dynata]
MSVSIYVCFSGGKDSLMMLHELKSAGEWDVVKLITTITAGYDRISMHGVRRELLHRQAAALEIPLMEVAISPQADNDEYESAMEHAWDEAVQSEIDTIAFGDIFLQDLKEYRERQLAAHALKCLFPLWQRSTPELVRTFIDLGYRAITTCVDPRKLDASFAGRIIDDEFLNALPEGVDPCGENGEFHSFVFDGPLFREPVSFSRGEVIDRDNFLFCELNPQ